MNPIPAEKPSENLWGEMESESESSDDDSEEEESADEGDQDGSLPLLTLLHSYRRW